MRRCGLEDTNECACRIHLFGVQYDGDSGDSMKMTKGRTGKSSAVRVLEEVTGGPLTFGNLMVRDGTREIREAIVFHFEGMREDGIQPPEPLSRVEYVEIAA